MTSPKLLLCARETWRPEVMLCYWIADREPGEEQSAIFQVRL